MSRKNDFIAAGTYGCVYRPSIPCRGNEEGDGGRGKVSKVFAKGYDMEKNREDFEDEIDRNQKAKEINADGVFTLTHVNACEIPSGILTDAEKESCADSDKPTRRNTLRNFSKGKVPQIVYKDGGSPLEKLWQNNIPLSQFLTDFQNVMQGLVKLNRHRHVHTDIKPGNIMYHPSEHRAKLVDFGFFDEESWLYRDALDNPNLLMHAYPYYPPEFKVLFMFTVPDLLKTSFASYIDNVYRQNLDDVSPDVIDRFFLTWPPLVYLFSRYAERRDKTSKERITFVEQVMQNMSPLSLRQNYQRVLKRFHFTTRLQQIDTFRQNLRSELRFQDFSLRANKRQQMQKLFVNQRFGAKIDLYSIGVTLLEVVSSYLMPLIIGQPVNTAAQAIDIPMHENIVALLYIVSGMVHPDPYVRFSAEEASDMYDIFVEALQMSNASQRTHRLQQIQRRVEERIPMPGLPGQNNAMNNSREPSPMNVNTVGISPRPSPMDTSALSQTGQSKRKHKSRKKQHK